MDILVISACPGTKRHNAVLDCEDIDTSTREELVEQYPNVTEPAARLYGGNEHDHVGSAVKSLREFATVDWLIISAGFGVVSAETPLPSYECTFSDAESNEARARNMGYDSEELTKKETLRAVANEKSIPNDLKRWLSKEYDIVFVVLGESYLIAAEEALSSFPNETKAFAFAAKGNSHLIGSCEWIPSTEEERSHFGTVWIELRGRQFKELAGNLEPSIDLSDQDAEKLHAVSLGRE